MNYGEAIAWLYGTQLFGIKLGLDNVDRLFDSLGLFRKLEGRRVIHVAGTNGKGSVCAMIDSICRAAGRRSGRFTSPHLVSFRERIRVDGQPVTEERIAGESSRIRDRVETWEPHPTFFEIVTALAAGLFCDADCEVLVMETGMGGRLDATNVLPAGVSVITPVAMDHQQWLGDSLGEIAAEKAGIIKEGVPVISAEQDPEAEKVIRGAAADAGSPVTFVDGAVPEDWTVRLAGNHQRRNAAVAVAAVRALDLEIGEDVIRAGLAGVSWPGRFQMVDDRIVIDGAHNEAAIKALVETWRGQFGGDKAVVIFGGVSSKNTAAILAELAGIAGEFVFVPVHSRRGLTGEELERIWRELNRDGIPGRSAESVGEVLRGRQRSGDERPVLVTGSLFLAGETLSELEEAADFEVSEQ